ncbi:MAG: AmmeMemoRadiSam system radical SAM enzyme [Theionarchaea archaeon]|nr:AmmeMemoRadiSam system radical SAM enzyme [Theionarchaea archaeon]
MKEARFYEKLQNNRVQCHLCPHECVIVDGKRGICNARENHDGILYSLIYEQVSSEGVDPIEKKPLYHFYPGSMAYSVGTVGCNLACSFCQNFEISQGSAPTYRMTPQEIIESCINSGCKSIAYTYNEPLIWHEFVFDTATEARKRGISNVLVTNGYINEEPLKALLPVIDALNVDLKSFTDHFYRKLCNGTLSPVLRTIEIAKSSAWVEITTLLIPGQNDSPEEITRLVNWVASLGEETPLHFSRYFPRHTLQAPVTPLEILEKALSIARERLRYVYIGNVPSHSGDNTYCYNCQQPVITRRGFSASPVGLTDTTCSRCGAHIDVIW